MSLSKYACFSLVSESHKEHMVILLVYKYVPLASVVKVYIFGGLHIKHHHQNLSATMGHINLAS